MTAQSSTSSAYARASWPYQTMSGWTATSIAATRPAARPASRAPMRNTTGTVSVPARAEKDRTPGSASPKARVQAQASR